MEELEEEEEKRKISSILLQSTSNSLRSFIIWFTLHELHTVIVDKLSTKCFNNLLPTLTHLLSSKYKIYLIYA